VLPTIGVWTVIYCPRKQAFLLARRSKYAKNPFLWNFFGGGADAGEKPKQAARRELREEAGITANKSNLIKLSRQRLEGIAYLGIEQDLHFFLLLTRRLLEPRLNIEHSEFRWFSQDNLPLSVNRPTWIAVDTGVIDKAIRCARKLSGKSYLD